MEKSLFKIYLEAAKEAAKDTPEDIKAKETFILKQMKKADADLVEAIKKATPKRN